MKKVLSMIMLAGMLTGTLYAAGAEVAKATTMAKANSGATLDSLSMAVYEAVKANPQQAVQIFQNVMSQRTNWSVTETYAVLRSVLLASPSLESSFVQNAAAYQNATAGYDAAAVNSLGYQLLTAVYTMPQTQSVAATVVQGVVGSSTAGRAAGNGVSAEVLNAYVPVAPVAPDAEPEYSVTPTPPPTSANN